MVNFTRGQTPERILYQNWNLNCSAQSDTNWFGLLILILLNLIITVFPTLMWKLIFRMIIANDSFKLDKATLFDQPVLNFYL